MRQNWDRIITEILKHEGGYVNHPRDNGGPTNRGITMSTLSGYLGRPASIKEVADLSEKTAKAIYKKNYWDEVKGDDLPSGIDYMVMDWAVHSGIIKASRFLQETLGVEVDGEIGPITVAAAKNSDIVQTVMTLASKRINYLYKHEDWDVFGRGWSKRVREVYQTSWEWAKNAGEVSTEHEPDPQPELRPQFNTVLSVKGDNSTYVKTFQTALKTRGYDLVPDGDFGDITEQNIRSFQTTNNLRVTGTMTYETISQLFR